MTDLSNLRPSHEEALNPWKNLAEAQAKLLVAYRLQDQKRAASAIDAIRKARTWLVDLGADVSGV